jgi:hypothetical protein
MDMTSMLITSTMMSTMHTKKELLMLFETYCIFGFWDFYKKLLCILVGVNKTMYGNNEDVPKKLTDNFYPDLHVRDITFAVVWNVLRWMKTKVSINHQ